MKRTRTVVALVVGLLIIGSALYFKGEEGTAPASVVAVGDESTRSYINSEGDWAKELDVMALRAAEDAPEIEIEGVASSTLLGTVTDSFARTFFEEFARGELSGALDDSNKELFLQASVAKLTQTTDDTLLTKNNIRIGTENDLAALRTYGNTIAAITQRHTAGTTEDELTILKRGLASENEEDFATLTNMAAAYSRILADTLEVFVPPELADEHVLLVNAYQAVGNDIAGMSEGLTDPVYALVRLQRHEEDAKAMATALDRIYQTLSAKGVRYTSDEPGALFQ